MEIQIASCTAVLKTAVALQFSGAVFRAYLYGDTSLSLQVHEVHGGSNVVLPPHLHTDTHTIQEMENVSAAIQ